jgi:hypothetical protein
MHTHGIAVYAYMHTHKMVYIEGHGNDIQEKEGLFLRKHFQVQPCTCIFNIHIYIYIYIYTYIYATYKYKSARAD